MVDPLTVADVRRAAFELCEFFEDVRDLPNDSRDVERFKAGQRYAAKRIRQGLGTWLTDEENKRSAERRAEKERLLGGVL